MAAPFRIVIMGDSSRPAAMFNSEMLSKLLTHVKGLLPQPDFIFFTGDMVYGGSKVREQLEAWKELVQNYYPITMFYTVLGSHENNETAFSDAFPYLPYGQLEGYKRTVYYFDYENTRFIILNSNHESGGSYAITSKQRAWLESTLASSDKKYNIVMLHVPAFPTGHHYGESLDGNQDERNALWTIFTTYNVTAVFTGHEHNYCRRLIDSFFDSYELKINKPVYQITTGGSGSSLNGHITDIRNVIVGPLAVYHYVVLDITDEAVILHAYDKDNILIDSCSLISHNSLSVVNIQYDIIIPMGTFWKYLDNGSDQGSAWRSLEFDDSGWPSGLAELGYGDGGEATIVSYGPNANKKYITTYFRKHFNIDNASIYKKLTLRIQCDDGAVVYLNSNEIYRTNMPQDIILFDTRAVRALRGADEAAFQSTTIEADFFRNGDNVIAVEIHQANSSSSDISFNLQLIGDT